jgi:hypothetical protein
MYSLYFVGSLGESVQYYSYRLIILIYLYKFVNRFIIRKG